MVATVTQRQVRTARLLVTVVARVTQNRIRTVRPLVAKVAQVAMVVRVTQKHTDWQTLGCTGCSGCSDCESNAETLRTARLLVAVVAVVVRVTQRHIRTARPLAAVVALIARVTLRHIRTGRPLVANKSPFYLSVFGSCKIPSLSVTVKSNKTSNACLAMEDRLFHIFGRNARAGKTAVRVQFSGHIVFLCSTAAF